MARFHRLLSSIDVQADRSIQQVDPTVGGRDPLFPPAAVHAAADMLPDARVVEIAGSGHSPYFEDPDAWNDAVSRFLASLER